MLGKYLLRGGLVAVLVLLMTSVGAAQGTPGTPNGVTARAVDGAVQLAWQPVAGADSYRVLRANSPGAAGQPVPGGSVTGTTFTDTGAANGQSFYYSVQAIDGGTPSSASRVTGATPRAMSCSSGNAIAVENCFPGTTSWKVDPGNMAAQSGIEGFATKTSVNAGQSVDLKINANVNGAPYRVEIYRTGYYGGNQGRLVGTIEGLTTVKQPACPFSAGNTGLKSCSNWSVSTTLTTGPDWPSGVYILKLTRTDNGRSNQILLVVRDDGGPQRLLYNVPDNTYQAYNNYGGKSVYPWNSTDAATVAGDGRAVKVSFDRPYQQVATRQRDFYTFTDLAAVSWLEQQGYSIAYNSSVDLEHAAPGGGVQAVWLGSHHEYWTAAMRSNLTAARNAGVSIASVGGNQIYWKVRYEAADRTMVVYKTTATGVEDPSGIDTGTWRDPQGANQPENALLGAMYVGDNDTTFFPLRVPYAQGQHRIWRHTPAATLQPGQTLSIGTSIVGWEWDARVANGREPAGVQSLSASPVNGELLQDAGFLYAPGNAVVEATIYEAASGALVFNAGTNHWARGLALNSRAQGNVRAEIQQATANLLADMDVLPTTPSGITLDAGGAPSVDSTTPPEGATDVPFDTTVTARFNRAINAATVTTSSFTLRRGGGEPIAAAVSYDAATQRAVLDPDEPLAAGATYTATISTAVQDSGGTPLPSPVSWSFTTRPVSVTGRSPAPDAIGVAPGTDVTATFGSAMDSATITADTFTLTPAGGSAVAASVSYSTTDRTARLDPSADLQLGTTYTARLTTAIRSSSGDPLPAAVTWTFTTRQPFTVMQREPAPLASGVSPSTAVRATFVRAADPASLTTSSFTLTGPGGPVAATVEYDAGLRQATLRPAAQLAVNTTYTAQLAATVRAADGQPLGTASSWTFTTDSAASSGPELTGVSPQGGASGVNRETSVTATFDRRLDPATVTGAAVSLRPAGGSSVAATLSYDDASRTVTLRPTAALAANTTYEARITTALRGIDGAPFAADTSWTFTTADCPCRLMDGLTPVSTGNSTRDGRSGTGPWTYELGTRIEVNRPADLRAIRYWRDQLETGTHRARLWSSTGVVLAEATYAGETASGWQRAVLSEPVRLEPGSTYVVSTNYNSHFVTSQFGLQTPLVNGPLQSAGQPNGVFGASAGTFPTQTWRSSNYFVDAEVIEAPGSPAPAPAVSSTVPASGASGVATGSMVEATFTVALEPSTLTTSTFSLRDAGGATVPATVSYDGTTRTARLDPQSSLTQGATYTARLTTGIRSTANEPMAAQYEWSFSVQAASGGVTVTSLSPSGGATGVDRATDVRASFSGRLDPASVTTSTVTLTPSSGAPIAATVSYDDASRSIRLAPSAPLAASTQYDARITTGVRALDGTPLATDVNWSFTTGQCACSLFAPTLTPVITNASVRDGRSGTGPWSRELGVKVEVTSPVQLTALRYYRASLETGAHTGRIWDTAGTLLRSVPFSGDTGAGWKQQTLSEPMTLTPGQVYVISVGFNAYYSATQFGLQTQVVDGPLRSSAVATNGVYSDAAGVFPTSSYRSSNYFIDLVVE